MTPPDRRGFSFGPKAASKLPKAATAGMRIGDPCTVPGNDPRPRYGGGRRRQADRSDCRVTWWGSAGAGPASMFAAHVGRWWCKRRCTAPLLRPGGRSPVEQRVVHRRPLEPETLLETPCHLFVHALLPRSRICGCKHGTRALALRRSFNPHSFIKSTISAALQENRRAPHAEPSRGS